MTRTSAKGWLKNILITAILIMAISIVVDIWRNKDLTVSVDNHSIEKTINQHDVDWLTLSYQKPVVLYLWATWCPSCRLVSPSINWLQQYQSDLNIKVFSVAIRSGDDRLLRAYMNSKEYRFPVINDPKGHISQQLGISATPTIIIVKNGKVFNSTTGVTTPVGLFARVMAATYL
ncbi:protein disulfide oxidoreductase [Photobacterium angustum]|uniref:Protein disulfide oxidoreductase n=1 Tax=Photobacterium angustum TaxID=661 RepID=A0A855SDD7_PHOAN|nr:protein disulfide oxidoreductase [Photobacterium angustum]KJF80826.1 thioredoxin [Photobacterium damselae subsp. damselae]KJG28910.1 thioredoxin [Photobacterium angustum]KJG38398.1 thioredoxin [Photobacterium angustum]KJG44289.1 thioredoxin [Photobacterium angustum]KJG48085.1 thioredoxin [Photobacterium angustum]